MLILVFRIIAQNIYIIGNIDTNYAFDSLYPSKTAVYCLLFSIFLFHNSHHQNVHKFFVFVVMLSSSNLFLQIYSPIRFIHTTCLLPKNYYEKLNLSKNCSPQDIKKSFIKLSKKYHPDINKRSDAHKNFLEINEAYKILSNPITRQNYDLRLVPYEEEYSSRNPYIHRRDQFTNHWKDPSFYENRDKSQDKYYAEQPYYGIKGVKKVSNITIVFLCLAISALGVALQLIAINKSITLHRDEMIRKSNEAQQVLDELKEAARRNGNDVQIERLKRKFADSVKNE